MESKYVFPSRLSGEIRIPPSKSIAHRALICAGLADGLSVVSGLQFSQDIEATIRCLQVLGCSIRVIDEENDPLEGRTLEIIGIGGAAKARQQGRHSFDCGESGSTLRFMIPIAAALGLPASYTGCGRLADRPLSVYEECFKGILNWRRGDRWLPLGTDGVLSAGIYRIPGNISSQFVSGLLFALPMLDTDSEIVLTTELESEPYVELTCGVLADFGIRIDRTERGYRIPGGQAYRPGQFRIEGDDSQAAFIAAAAALSAAPEGVLMTGLRRDSRQGDRAFLDVLRQMGVPMRWEEHGVRVFRTERLIGGADIDASQTPDLVPVEAAVFALADGESRIRNAARLRIKESDRLAVTATQYSQAGAILQETDDGLLVTGQPDGITGGTADSCGDHRIAMSLAVLAQRASQGILITDSGSVRKSWPTFWEDFRGIGGSFE
ncbi:MAG: 3-phosphoshikimate 1-carboxyvinyltransferase [Firmicutes bacterium]|nr:3-phosphoshikimate 1-carboxyvinyltransferase [Bacillota bacterium]